MTRKQTIKLLGYITLGLICLCCLGIDAWWILIYKYGPNKVEDNVVYADTLEATDGSKANIFEIKYYSNANKNGLEMFEIKISGLIDTKATAITSQGLQYVANDKTDKIAWNYVEDGSFALSIFSLAKAMDGDYSEMSEAQYSAVVNLTTIDDNGYNYHKDNIFHATENRAFFQHFETLSGSTRYNYSSLDNWNIDTGLATNPIEDSSFFRIQLQEKDGEDNITYKPYAFKFRGDRTVAEIKNAEEKPMYQVYGRSKNVFLYTCDYTDDIYPFFNIDFLSWRLYEKVKSMPAGSNQYSLVEFGDWFDYYNVDSENSTFVQDRLPVDKTNKVRTLFTSYYGMKITVSADGATRASDSMFKVVHGSPEFNISEDVSSGDYLYGRSVITLGLQAFDKETNDTGETKLKIKESFVKDYYPSRKSIVLNIIIDKDELKKSGLTFGGFAEDSGLEDFSIYQCYTTEVIDGVVIKTEVKVC